MPRRSLFTALLSLLPFAWFKGHSKTISPTGVLEGRPPWHYRGWHIIWTGWIRDVTPESLRAFYVRAGRWPKTQDEGLRSHYIVGHWKAHRLISPGKNRLLYVAVPGGAGEYLPGGRFDIRHELQLEDSAAKKYAARQDGFERLLKLIDEIEGGE